MNRIFRITLNFMMSLFLSVDALASYVTVYEETKLDDARIRIDTYSYVNYEDGNLNLITAVQESEGMTVSQYDIDTGNNASYLKTSVIKNNDNNVKTFLWTDSMTPLSKAQTPGRGELYSDDITIKLNDKNLFEYLPDASLELGGEYTINLCENNFEYFPEVQVNIDNSDFISDVETDVNGLKQIIKFYYATRINENKSQAFSGYTLNYERYSRPLAGEITINYVNENPKDFAFKGKKDLFETTDNVHYKNKGLKGLELCTIPGNSQYSVADGLTHGTVYNTLPLKSDLGEPIVGKFPAYTVYSRRSGLGDTSLGVSPQSVATGSVVSYPDGMGLDDSETLFIGPSIWSDGARVTSSNASIHSDAMTYADLYIKYNVDLYKFTLNKDCEVMVFATEEHTGYEASDKWRKFVLDNEDAITVVRMNNSHDKYRYVYTGLFKKGDEVTITTPGNTAMLMTFVKPMPNSEAPMLSSISVDGIPLNNFNPKVHEYTYGVSSDNIKCPEIYAESAIPGQKVTVENPKYFPGTAYVKVVNKYGMETVYTITYYEKDNTGIIKDLNKVAAKKYDSLTINNKRTTGDYASKTFTDLDMSALTWQYAIDVKKTDDVYNSNTNESKLSVFTDRNGLPGGANANGNPDWGAILSLDGIDISKGEMVRASWDMTNRAGYYMNTNSTVYSQTPTLADIWKYPGSFGVDFYSFGLSRKSMVYIISQADISSWARFAGFKRVEGASATVKGPSDGTIVLGYVYARILDKDSVVMVKSPGTASVCMAVVKPMYDYEGDYELQEPVRGAFTDVLFEDFTLVEEGTLPEGVVSAQDYVYTEKHEVLPGYTKNCLILDDQSYDSKYNGVYAGLDFEPQEGITEVTVRYKYLKPEECPYASVVFGFKSSLGELSRTVVASSNGKTMFNYGYNDESSLENAILSDNSWYTLRYIINFNSENNAHIDVVLTNEGKQTTNVIYGADFEDGLDHSDLTGFVASTSVYGGKFVFDYIRVRQVEKTLFESGEDPYANIKKGTEQIKIPTPKSHAVEGKLNIILDGNYKYTTKNPYVAENGSIMITAKNLAEIFNFNYYHNGNEFVISSDEEIFTYTANSDILQTNTALINLKDKTVPSDNQLYVPANEFLSRTVKDAVLDTKTNTLIITSR